MTPQEIIAGDRELASYRVGELLARGPLSRKWLLHSRAGQVPLVLRVDQPLAAELRMDRLAEWSVLQRLAAHGLQPAPHARGQDYLLVPFVSGTVWQAGVTRPAAELQRLGRLLAALHGVPIDGLDARFDLATRLELYAARIRRPWADAVARDALKLWHALADGSSRSICHNDAVPGNIVANGSDLVLIDWEFAGVGYAGFELAVVAEEHALSAPQIDQLQAGYEDGKAAPVQRFDDWRRLYRMTAELWSGVLGGAAAAG